MKPALIRSVDAQGRIILPVEIRRTMGISSGDILEIRPSDQGIYLSKYKANMSGKRQIKKYLNLLYSATGCSMAICNCDEVLVSKGIFLREELQSPRIYLTLSALAKKCKLQRNCRL